MSTVTQALATDRAVLIRQLNALQRVDLIVVGGGATGLGIALDAVLRGLQVVLLESHDFAKGTSSRSTKLVHGGVRYLAQGNISLVQEALQERSLLLQNAPHIAQPLAFVMPAYHWWEPPFYATGLKMYDMLAGRAGLGATRMLGRRDTLASLPTLRAQGLKGGVMYWDGQFDDARLALTLARTAAQHGALLLNYCQASELLYAQGRVDGVIYEDALTGVRGELRAGCVINATGVWVDALRQMDGQVGESAEPVMPIVAPSQGVHMVVAREFLGSQTALIVPKTADGRVLFAVPWLGKVILGTTDTAIADLPREPLAFEHEIDFILRESARYLRLAPRRQDVKSVWVGLRPLVKSDRATGHDTKSLSREHSILVSANGLVTVTGGKWTTYRAMAEEVLLQCQSSGLLPRSTQGMTRQLRLIGAGDSAISHGSLAHPAGWHSYGAEQDLVRALPGANDEICPGLAVAMVRFAARHEYAITVEDVLARRSRLLFLDAQCAIDVAARVADVLTQETGLDARLRDFYGLAANYLLQTEKKV